MNLIRLILELSMLIVLALISIQDFTDRKISVYLVVCTAILSISINSTSSELTTIIYQTFYNMIFLLIQLLFLFAYFKLKNSQTKVIDQQVGLGDVLFLLALTPLLPLLPFIFLYLLSLLVAVVYFIFKSIQNKTNLNYEIPLAGIIAGTTPVMYLLFGSHIISVTSITFLN